jgi:hypothetical protein
LLENIENEDFPFNRKKYQRPLCGGMKEELA